MHFGASIFFTDSSITPAGLGRALEERGFESVWAAEHSHIPLSRKSPWGGGGDLPKQYYDVMDPFVTLTAAACATKTLKIGTGVCLVNQRDPIQLAKLVASIDQVSAGRFLFGVGNGWNQDEMENHGTVFATRHKLVRERIEAMREIWTKSKAEYHGEFVNFDPMMTWPKPVQKPHPEIIVGGDGPRAVDHMVEYGDGWLPHPTGGGASLEDRIKAANEKLAAVGRKPVPITVFGATGGDEETAEYERLGVARCVLRLPPRGRDEVLPALDRFAKLLARNS